MRSSVYRHTLILSLLMALMLGSRITHAQQAANLLVNPAFEGGFTVLQGEQPRSVANGWVPWNAPRPSGASASELIAPKYVAASAANALGIQPRSRSGDAQIYYSFFETHDAGIYQQVSGLTTGQEYRFSIDAYVWSSTFEDFDLSEDPGGVAVRVGIDPTGGTDPLSLNVVYSPAQIAYDTFRQYSLIVPAQSSTITVFVRSTVTDPVQNTYVYLDDAVLAQTVEPVALSETPTPSLTPEPSATPTNTSPALTNTTEPSATPTNTIPAPSNTPQPSATPTNTVPAPSNTPQPSATPTNTVPAPSNTPQLSATPTNTIPAASDTPQPSATATATPTQDDPTPTIDGGGLIPTATEIGDPTFTPTTPAPIGGGDDPTITPVFPNSIIHVVVSGDTVSALAVRYNSTTQAIIEANGLDESAFIQVGDRLVIPVPAGTITATPTATMTTTPATATPVVIVVTATFTPTPIGNVTTPPGTSVYIVRYGDTLSGIARLYNTTVTALMQLNGITNPNRVLAGQRLIVPVGGALPPAPTTTPFIPAPPVTPTVDAARATPFIPTVAVVPTVDIVNATPFIQVPNMPQRPPVVYVVQPGDTLIGIAVRFGTNIRAITDLNGIRNPNLIFTGQRVLIP